MGWCDDPRSKRYNQLIRYPFKFSSEKLFRSDNLYDIIIVLNFNMRPIKKIREVLFLFTCVEQKRIMSLLKVA